MAHQVSQETQHERVSKCKARRKPRELTLEANQVGEQSDQLLVGNSLDELLTDFLVRMIYQKVETGELVVEEGVVRINAQGQRDEN